MANIIREFRELLNFFPEEDTKPSYTLWMVFLGFLVGLATGVVISLFRITTSSAFATLVSLAAAYWDNLLAAGIWIFLCIVAALVVGWLARNPAIRFGGEKWEFTAIEQREPRAWLRILLPKFIGSWLVMAFGISVGREGPCIQMGAATAMGMKTLDAINAYERRFFVLGGCAAGLAAAFSAPFAGICYVYEVMGEKISRQLLAFMLAGGFGVYLACTMLFGLGVMIPFSEIVTPGLGQAWQLLPIGIFCGLVGVAYNYLIRISMWLYGRQKLVPERYRPLFPFIGAALMLIFFPAICGEGLTVFPAIENGSALFSYLWLFLIAKLFFTAYCYGSSIPAGLMVPLLCVGGVAGGIYFEAAQFVGLLSDQYVQTCMVLGMISAFAAGEKAPVTAIVLVLEMTGAYALAPQALLCVACAAFTARICRVGDM